MVSTDMKRRLAEELDRIDYSQPVADVRNQLIAIMQPYCWESRVVAARVAAEFYDGIREFVLGERVGAIAIDNYDPDAVERRVRSAVTPLAKVQQTFYWADDVRLDEDYQREMAQRAGREMGRALAEYVGYGVKDAAGSTVFGNGRRDPRRTKFARVPRGSKSYPNGCPFCQMLASRGFVYRSKLTAGGIDPDHYHDNCQCMVVPGWKGASVEGYNPRDYDAGYQEYLDQDHSEHEEHVAETQRNRYDAQGRLKSGDGNRVDEKGILTAEDRALIRSKRTAAGNETRKADRSRMFFNLGVTENEWKAMSEAEQAALLESRGANARSPRNLGSGRSYSRLPAPTRVEGVSFDPSDASEVERLKERYRDEIRHKPVEHAYIMTSDGEVWHAVGDASGVNIDAAPLDGAIVMHNHVPRGDEPAWTFGSDDFKKLQEHPEIRELWCSTAGYDDVMMPTETIGEATYDDVRGGTEIDFTVIGQDIHKLVMERLDALGFIDYRRC